MRVPMGKWRPDRILRAGVITAGLLLILTQPGLSRTESNTGEAGTPIGGPARYEEHRLPDDQVDWGFLANFMDRGVGDSRHSRYFVQQFNALFPGDDVRRMSGTAAHALTRQCGGNSTSCDAVPPGTINNEFYLARFRTSRGSDVEITLSSTGQAQTLATAGSSCSSCNFVAVGAALATVRNSTDADAPVGHLYFQTTGGRVVYQSFNSSVTVAGGGAAPFTGPTILDEDSPQSWQADISRLELPAGAYNIDYEYRWRASDGTTGDSSTFTHTFEEPGEASLSLEIQATYTIDVPRTDCSVSGSPPVVSCVTRSVPEQQGPTGVSGGRKLKVRDITPPDLRINFPQGRVDVAEAFENQPAPKLAQVVTSGRFTPVLNVRIPYNPIEAGRYQIEKNRAFDVTLQAADNSGTSEAHWRLDLSGSGIEGAITDTGGRIDELEANYPVGAVDYEFTATAGDGAGNQTVVLSSIEVRDVNLPEIPLHLRHPDPFDEDRFYTFFIETDLLLGETGDPVPGSISDVTRDFTNPTWAAQAEIEKGLIGGEDFSRSIRQRTPFKGRQAEIRSDRSVRGENRLAVEMRLLNPGPQRLDLWVRRKFNYEQRVGRSGRIKKTQLFVKARAAFGLMPRDITPPAISLELDPRDTDLPREGGARVVMSENPENSEPLPDKTGSVSIQSSPGFSASLDDPVSADSAPAPMTALAGAPTGFQWQATLARLALPSDAVAGPGHVIVPQDFFIPEDVPLSLDSGSGVTVRDNLTEDEDLDLDIELEVIGTSATLSSVAADGFPTPNYVPAHTVRDGLERPASVALSTASYVLKVTARDEAGNTSRLNLPVSVLDVSPPALQVHLLGQDARGDLNVITSETPPNASIAAKELAFDVSGFYIDPSAQTEPQVEFTTRLRYPPEDTFHPDSGPRLPWIFGLYHGSDDGNPGNTDPAFGDQVPEELTGAVIRQNVRIAVKILPEDNGPAPENKDYINQAGLQWSIKQTDGLTFIDGNPGTFIIRAPNFPRDRYPDEPEYRFTVEATDVSGNTLELRIPLNVLELNAVYKRIDWEQRRYREQ